MLSLIITCCVSCFQNTSEWTLDYPPGFAYFEYALSHLAQYADRGMLNISSTPYISPAALTFQRATVIISDSVFIGAVIRWV